jgi:hemolysin III
VAVGRRTAYIAGAIAFMFDSKLRYAHFVWHLVVLGECTCRFFAKLRYAS